MAGKKYWYVMFLFLINFFKSFELKKVNLLPSIPYFPLGNALCVTSCGGGCFLYLNLLNLLLLC